jgi:hypothetical protein
MKVIETATKYIGTKESKGNVFVEDTNKFNDKVEFAVLVHQAGQKDGESWCAYTGEVFFKLSYPEHFKEFDKLFSANCVQTLENFRKAGYGISSIPKLGAVMILRHYTDGVPDSHGHMGVVTVLHSNTEWTSVEGNTNKAGSREGEIIGAKSRDLMYHPTGMRVEGFIMIVETLKLN